VRRGRSISLSEGGAETERDPFLDIADAVEPEHARTDAVDRDEGRLFVKHERHSTGSPSFLLREQRVYLINKKLCRA
jgi:hypothetical protein